MTGYSDRINHALAFAAKHHDQLVRRGTRAPYFTQPANLAVILTRYGRSETCVTAAILLEVVEDYSREGYPDGWLQRIGEKFGDEVLATATAVSEHRVDNAGLELDYEERRADVLARMATVGPDGRWLMAARALHEAGSLLADLRRTVDLNSVWQRLPLGRDRTIAGFRRVSERLREVGFEGSIRVELSDTIRELERFE